MSTPPNPSSLELAQNIYLTSRIRMRSEVRLKRKNSYINLLITIYSFLLICVSIPGIQEATNVTIPTNISLMLSIAVLVSSVFMQGERYAERAAAFRQSYLGLQALYSDPNKADDDKLREYHLNLNACENHTDSDYRSAIVAAWMHGKNLRNSLEEISIQKPLIIRHFAERTGEILVYVFFLILPMVFTFSAK